MPGPQRRALSCLGFFLRRVLLQVVLLVCAAVKPRMRWFTASSRRPTDIRQVVSADALFFPKDSKPKLFYFLLPKMLEVTSKLFCVLLGYSRLHRQSIRRLFDIFQISCQHILA